MRHRVPHLLAVQAILVASAALLVIVLNVPLGVPGEWTWARIEHAPPFGWLPLGVLGVGSYAVFAWWGSRGLANPSRRVEVAWVSWLAIASVSVQVIVMTAAPEGCGLTKWSTIRLAGAGEYLMIAERDVNDIPQFWADYPSWLRRQNSAHLSTHPPGLIVGARLARNGVEAHPMLADWIVRMTPPDLAVGIRSVLWPMSKSERATIVVIGGTTLLACALTVVPIYLLARARLSPSESWAAASLWPLVPSAILFQPTADCAYPLLSTSAILFAAWACRSRSVTAVLSGIVLAVGMQFTLAFLPVGLIVAIVEVAHSGPRWRRIIYTALGFFGLTGLIWMATSANPFLIWWLNVRNHARFYEQFPRSYVAWVFIDVIELAVAVGLPAFVWAIRGLANRRDLVASWSTVAVLLFLNLSGKNLSEVARLWLPFMPMLLIAAGAGMKAAGGGAKTLAATIVLVGLETLLIQTTIQVVYPV